MLVFSAKFFPTTQPKFWPLPTSTWTAFLCFVTMFSFQEGTDNERMTRGLSASSYIRGLSTGGKPQEKQCHCPKKQQLFRPISSFTTQAHLPKFRRRVISRPKRVVERKGPLVKYGGCDRKSFQIVEWGWIMSEAPCTSMWDRALCPIWRMCSSLQIPTIQGAYDIHLNTCIIHTFLMILYDLLDFRECSEIIDEMIFSSSVSICKN